MIYVSIFITVCLGAVAGAKTLLKPGTPVYDFIMAFCVLMLGPLFIVGIVGLLTFGLHYVANIM